MAEKERGAPGAVQAEIDKYLDLLAKDPKSRVFAPLAEAYRKAGFLDEAIQTAIEGLKVHPNYLGGRVALGRAYHEKKMLAEAREEMQKVVTSAPDNLMAHKLLGQIAYDLSDLPAAQKAFQTVLLLDPRDQEAKLFLEKLGGGAPAAAGERAAPLPRPSPPRGPFDFVETSAPPPPPPRAEPPPPPPSAAPPPPAPPAPPLPDVAEPEELSMEDVSLEAAPLSEVSPAEPELEEIPQPFAAEEPSPVDFTDVGGTGRLLEPQEPLEEKSVPAAAAPPEIIAAEAPEIPTGHGISEEESPFEIFGRPRGSGPPVSTKGEEGFRELDLEATAHAPVGEVEPEGSSPFQMFTRDSRSEKPAARPRERHGEGAGFRDIEFGAAGSGGGAEAPSAPEAAEEPATPAASWVEQTEDWVMTSPAAKPVNLEEEIPQIDLVREMEVGTREEAAPAAEVPGPPVPAEEPVPVLEPGPVSVGVPALEPVQIEDAFDDFGLEPPPAPLPVNLEEEIPRIDLAREVELPLPGGEEEEPAPSAAGRGVFDTETLASIYINQGFYGRAAEIYQRLVQERPADRGLQQKLAEVLALEQQSAVAATLPHPPPPARGEGDDEKIRRLQMLLDGLKGGRPQ